MRSLIYGLLFLGTLAHAQTEVKVVEGPNEQGHFVFTVDQKEHQYHEVLDGRLVECNGEVVMSFEKDGKEVTVKKKDLKPSDLNWILYHQVCKNKA